MMSLSDVRAPSSLVHGGFTIGFPVQQVQTLAWPPGVAGLETEGLDHLGDSIEW